MKHLTVGLLFVAVLTCTPHGVPAAESDGPYLFEQLKKPAYRKTFNAMFLGQRNLEPWLKGYITDRNGVDSPGETRTIDGKTYELYQVCQPHNCINNFIYVFFEPGGSRAWALFTKDDGTTRFFGNPDPNLQTALRAVAE